MAADRHVHRRQEGAAKEAGIRAPCPATAMVYGCDTTRPTVVPWLTSPLPAPAESTLKDLQVQLSRYVQISLSGAGRTSRLTDRDSRQIGGSARVLLELPNHSP